MTVTTFIKWKIRLANINSNWFLLHYKSLDSIIESRLYLPMYGEGGGNRTHVQKNIYNSFSENSH